MSSLCENTFTFYNVKIRLVEILLRDLGLGCPIIFIAPVECFIFASDVGHDHPACFY